MASPLEATALGAFLDAFRERPTLLARAPGRVELLGNHTDYNGGLVLAAAIDRFTVIAGRPAEGREGRAHSVAFKEDERFALDAMDRRDDRSWGRYLRGVVWALEEAHGALRGGFEAAIAGDIPLGAGLSSSASLQAAFALLLIGAGRVGDEEATPRDDRARMELAAVLQRGENAYVGVQSGRLDQFSVLFGRAGMALGLDCRSFESDRVPLGTPAPAIVVCDSKTSRRLADGMYNRRREECERVVAAFRDRRGEEAVRSLRDVTLDDLEAAWDALDPVGRRRARHVLTENARVLRGVALLRGGDQAGFGRVISASHASSRDDFENSAPALDALVEAAEAAPGFLGGKLSGAGWAGCTVNLVESSRADDFGEAVRTSYARRTDIVPDVHVCHAADGASCRAIAPDEALP